MAIIVYPKCPNDDIREGEVDFTNPLNKEKHKPQPPNKVCAICAPGRRIIANGNRFDGIPKEI